MKKRRRRRKLKGKLTAHQRKFAAAARACKGSGTRKKFNACVKRKLKG